MMLGEKKNEKMARELEIPWFWSGAGAWKKENDIPLLSMDLTRTGIGMRRAAKERHNRVYLFREKGERGNCWLDANRSATGFKFCFYSYFAGTNHEDPKMSKKNGG